MSHATATRWKTKRTPETRQVEAVLRQQFPHSDAYRYNSASIRVRIIDPRFEGKSTIAREKLVEPLLKQLPADTLADIINLLTASPDEIETSLPKKLDNVEFEDPSPSKL